ncbi:MAG: hypothetical protein E7256_13605 [Lachnospiraceae bacterium]|nr:hypothetical protein [Lachnospiraceae bacterium]
MKKKGTLKTFLVMLVLAAGILAGYYAINNRAEQKAEAQYVETEKDKLLTRNIENSYPATPREVVKLYSRILKCIYNEDLTEAEMKDLMKQARLLYDEELLEENPEDNNVNELKIEREQYKAEKKSIFSVAIEKANNVITWTDAGKEYASIVACYTLKEDVTYTRTYEKFLLRKDLTGRYKIVGWGMAEEADME